MSKTRPVKGVGWDVAAIGNGKCKLIRIEVSTFFCQHPCSRKYILFDKYSRI